MNTSGPSGKTAASSIASSAIIGEWGVEVGDDGVRSSSRALALITFGDP
jgi:hypothetical protein